MLANMEHYGKTEGNWAQMTPEAIEELRRQGYFANYTNDEIMANPSLYEAAVANFWDKGNPISTVPETQRGLWWLNPAQFDKTGGDIEKVTKFASYKTDEEARSAFRNRLKNAPRQRALYNQYRASQNNNEAASLGQDSEAAFSQ